MSLITYRPRKHAKPPTVSGRTGRRQITLLAPTSLPTIVTARRFVALARRAYPMLLVSAIFAAVLVATIALRMLIWLPFASR
jgi:hypothetical protein